MGLSAFWTAIKRPRTNGSSDSRKHVDRVYDHHHTVAPVQTPGDEPRHHFDAIYDTHHHILPAQETGPKRNPSSPPRIHSPTTTKQHNKPSLWKSASLSVKPSQTSDALKHEKSMKRRSFWRHERKDSGTAPAPAPAVQRPDPVPRPAHDRRQSKRNSYWQPGPENHRILPASEERGTELKAKRSSRRFSLRRTISSQSSNRNSLRFSFLANGAGDSDEEDIPAIPAIPANIQRHKSSSRDVGRHMGVGGIGVVQPGTAVTSDDVYSAPPKSRNSLKRQSLSKLITGRKSVSDIPTESEDRAGVKRKHRSWFSVHGSESSPETAIPPMPTLPTASGAPANSSEAAFHAFLHNIHDAAPRASVTTDYERFLRASQVFDDSIPTLPHHPQRNSYSDMHAPRPRPISTAVPTALPQIQERSPRRASRCRPRKSDTDANSTASPTSPSLLSNEQQREWNKLRQLMDDDRSQPSGSDRGSSDDGHEDNDGVMGMLRELSRDEALVHSREEKRRHDRERYLGFGTFENKDALAALERGARG